MRFVFINTGTKQQNAGIIRCLGLGSQLASQGHEVIILLPNLPENLANYGKRFQGVEFIYTSSGLFREELSKLLALCRVKDPDVVHCMGAGTNIFLPALAAKKFFGRKFTLLVDYEDKQPLLVPPGRAWWHWFLTHLSFRYADLIVCASSWLVSDYQAHAPGKVHYIPMGFSEDTPTCCRPQEDTGSLKSRKKIGYLGAMVPPYKDQVCFILKAFPLIRSQCSQAQLHIIGDGPEKSELMRIAEQSGEGQSIVFHGHVDDKALLPLLCRMDILAFPFADTDLNRSRCPHKVFLYAQTGLPIVTNPVGEVYNLLASYPNTYYFEAGNVDSFCKTTLACLSSQVEPTSKLVTFFAQNSWEMRASTYLSLCRNYPHRPHYPRASS